MMTDYLNRFVEDMSLAGYSPRSIDMYVRAVSQLIKYYQKLPEKITDEELRQYFLYNKTQRGWSRTASTIALCGIKLFYKITLTQNIHSFFRPDIQYSLLVVCYANYDHAKKMFMSLPTMFKKQICIYSLRKLILKM